MILDASLRRLRGTLHGYEGSHVIQMEVEEVNQSQKLTTQMPLNTKEQSSLSMMSVTSLEKAEVVEYDDSYFLDDGA